MRHASRKACALTTFAGGARTRPLVSGKKNQLVSMVQLSQCQQSEKFSFFSFSWFKNVLSFLGENWWISARANIAFGARPLLDVRAEI
jgi:hypothetical protein